MTEALVELSFHKVGKFVMIFREKGGECIGHIKWDQERGILFCPGGFCGELSMVELGIIRAKMDDVEAGW
jgi:hypothetical protein